MPWMEFNFGLGGFGKLALRLPIVLKMSIQNVDFPDVLAPPIHSHALVQTDTRERGHLVAQ